MKGKRILSWILTLCMLLAFMPAMTVPASADDVIQIGNYEQLKAFAARVNGGETTLSAKLTEDIVCKNNPGDTAYADDWTPIGVDEDHAFAGKFYGDNHVITGLKYDRLITVTEDYKLLFVGLFGRIASGGTVQDLYLEDCSMNLYVDVDGAIGNEVFLGAIAGSNIGTVTNCRVFGKSGLFASLNYGALDMIYVGGITGYGQNGTLTNCCFIGDVKISATAAHVDYVSAGGIVGYNHEQTIKNCFHTGTVHAETNDSTMAGGVVGYNNENIINCRHTGSVKGTGEYETLIGGVVGVNTAMATVKNCYARGAVTANHTRGDLYLGAVAGINNNRVNNCCYDTALAGDIEAVNNISDGSYTNVVGLAPEAFANARNFSSWENFNTNWVMGVDQPELKALSAEVLLYSNDNQDLVTNQFIAACTPTKFANKFTYDGHRFTGWNTNPDGHGTSYGEDDEIILKAGQTLALHAQWKDITKVQTMQMAVVELNNSEGKDWGGAHLELNADYGTLDLTGVPPYPMKVYIPIQPGKNFYGYYFQGNCAHNEYNSFKITLPDGQTFTYSDPYDGYSLVFNIDGTYEYLNEYEVCELHIRSKSRLPLTTGRVTVEGGGYSSAFGSHGGTAVSSLALMKGITYNFYWTEEDDDDIAENTEINIRYHGEYRGFECPNETADQQNNGWFYKIEMPPFEIDSAEKLFAFAKMVNENGYNMMNAVLTADIDLSGTYWTPVGTFDLPYIGTFDGQGHTISGLTIINNSSYYGLFGLIGAGGCVKKLVVGGKISPGRINTGYMGSIAGYNEGTIECCGSTCEITTTAGTEIDVGGIVGKSIKNTAVKNCYYTGKIKIRSGAGDVTAWIGGIVGNADVTTEIQNCYSTAELSGENFSGHGLYESGISGNHVGQKTGCFYYGRPDSNATSLTPDEFKEAYRFKAAGWDFRRIWYMGENSPLFSFREADPIEVKADTSALSDLFPGEDFSVPLVLTKNGGFCVADISSSEAGGLTLDGLRVGEISGPHDIIDDYTYYRAGNFTTETGVLCYVDFTVPYDASAGPITIGSDIFEFHFIDETGCELLNDLVFIPGTVNIIVPTLTVTVSCENATISAGSASQSVPLGDRMDIVRYTANDGYYFPEDYNMSGVNGITVDRVDYNDVSVCGHPERDTTLVLTPPTAKTTPAAPSSLGKTDCTTEENNDGTITGVDSTMEYQKDGESIWISVRVGQTAVTGLSDGTYRVRYKKTYTTTESAATDIVIGQYVAPTWTVHFDKNTGSGNMPDVNDFSGDYELPGCDFNPPSEDLVFASWKIGNDLHDEGDHVDISADTTVVAMWKYLRPSATFTATGADTGTLSNLASGMKYRIDDGQWQTVSGESVDLTNLSPCTVTIYTPGDGTTTLDSDEQTITVTKADTPDLSCTQPSEINGKGSIPATEIHEISTDKEEWAGCKGESTELEPGKYYVRVKADGETLASEAQEIEINEFVPEKESVPETTFTATGKNSGMLSGLEAGMKFKVGDGEWNIIRGTSVELTDLVPCTITVVMQGDGRFTADSEPQYITVKQAETPKLTETQPAEIDGKGSIPTTEIHEISTDKEEWADCNGESTDLEPGKYYVRVKADGETLASEEQEITIYEFDPDKEARPEATFTATDKDAGVLANVSDGMKYKIDDGEWQTVKGESVELTGLEPCIITIIMPGNGETTVDSEPQTIEISRAAAPELAATQPETVGDKGSIPTTAAHQRSVNGTDWEDCDGVWSDLDEGTYYVRTKADGAVLASDMQTLVISLERFVITFTDEDGTELQSCEFARGETPVYKGETPKKTETDENTYVFDGWEPELAPVTAAQTYKAKYSASAKEYAVTFETNGGSVINPVSVKYGEAAAEPAAPEKASFTFAGWYADEGLQTPYDFTAGVTADITVYAKWEAVSYTVEEGQTSVWKQGTDKEVTIKISRSAGDGAEHFEGVEIDGIRLEEGKDYAANEDKTVITLKVPAFEGLTVGEHTVTVRFDDGVVETKLTVAAAEQIAPKTADSNIELCIAMMILSGMGIVVLASRKKRLI